MTRVGQAIIKIAKQMKLLDGAGALKKMDSLALIDFVLELEKSLNIAIPSSALLEEDFHSLAGVEALVERFQS